MISQLSLLFLLCLIVAAQVVPFTLDGSLDSASTDTSIYNSGGIISVNGISITVPKNLQVQFPAAWVPYPQVASGSFLGNEVNVIGNYVNGKAIAALITMMQYQLETSSGIVQSINSADGSMTITGGTTVRINDPNAVYSKGYTLNPDFTADDQNPSITAFTGFPMCIPRSSSDSLCPSTNRPSGTSNFQAPDASLMAPFVVGDYVTYSGIKVNGEIICYSIVAMNVFITTTGVPAFIRVETAQVGVYDGTNSEFADTTFAGHITDASQSIIVSALDVDPCTGKATDRSVGTATVVAGVQSWKWRTSSTTLTKYAREYHITASGGTTTTKNGLLAGQYVQPVLAWVFPETLTMGVTPFANSFAHFAHLVNGIGPDSSGNVYGQLSPFPDGTTPTATVCTSSAPVSSSTSAYSSATTLSTVVSSSSSSSTVLPTPVANAGSSQTIRPGVIVNLSGSNTNTAIASTDLTYLWTQTSGSTISLSNTAIAAPSFTAPASTAKSSIVFSLTISSISAGTNNTSSVTIVNDPTVKDVVAIDSYTWTSNGGGTLAVTAHTNVVDGTAKLSLALLNPTAGTATAMTSPGSGKYSVSIKGVKKPSNGVQVTSGFGGTASLAAVTS